MKKLLLLCGILTVLACVIVTGGAVFLLHVALDPNPAYQHYDEDAEYRHMAERYPHISPWLDSIRSCGAVRDTFIANGEGRLHAYLLPARRDTAATALLIHGYKNCALGMLHIAYMYHHDLGYNVVLPDMFAHGASDGDHIRMGWFDRLDVLRWAAIADSTFGGRTRQVIHGISMGGATTMMVAGTSPAPEASAGGTLPDYIRAFVDDCGYTSVWDEFEGELKVRYGLPAFPVLYVASAFSKIKYGWSFGEASALDQVSKCDRPMLFIHGDADTFVPIWMVHPLYEAKPGEKTLWLAPGTAHAAAYADHQEEYTRQVKEFLLVPIAAN